MTPLEITANGQKIATLRLATAFGRPHVARAHADARFYGHEQFTLTTSVAGWVIVPVAGVLNPTLVNGVTLNTPTPVSDGMTVSVRGAAGLVLTLRILDAVPVLAPSPGGSPAPATLPSAPPPSGSPPGTPAPSTRPYFTSADFWQRPWPLGRWLDIEVCIDPWAVGFAVLFLFLGLVSGGVAGFLGQAGVVLMLLFSVVAHEFGHALAARRCGIRTRQIRLVPLGGYAELERNSSSAREEYLIVAAGPAVNLVLAVLSIPVAAVFSSMQPFSSINGGLFLFNLIPVFPLDGGRLLRAYLHSRVSGARLTELMQMIGKGSSVAVGLIGLLLRRTDLCFAAFFLWRAASTPVPPAGFAPGPIPSVPPTPVPRPASPRPGGLSWWSQLAARGRSLAGRGGDWLRSGPGRLPTTAAPSRTSALGGLILGVLGAAMRSSGSSGGSGGVRVREGDSSYGRILLTIDGDRVRRGDSSYGDILMRFDGNKIRQGDSSYGRVVANVDGNKIRQGDSTYGNVIATIDGNKVRQGDSSYGTVIATTEGGRMSAAAGAVYLLAM